MRQQKSKDPLSQLLQRGDPAGDANDTPADPNHRTSLLARCTESLETIRYTPESVGRKRISLALGALVLTAGLCLVFFLATRQKPQSHVPQIAAIASPVHPLPETSPQPTRTPNASPIPATAASYPARKAKRNPTIARKRTGKKRGVVLAVRQSSGTRPLVPIIPRPKIQEASKSVPESAPGPVVERIILIADGTPSEPKPKTESVTITLTEKSKAIVVAQSFPDETRR